MPENEIFNAERLSQTAGIFNGTVMLFIRFETVSVFIQAEGFVEQPVSIPKGIKQKIRAGFITGKSDPDPG